MPDPTAAATTTAHPGPSRRATSPGRPSRPPSRRAQPRTVCIDGGGAQRRSAPGRRARDWSAGRAAPEAAGHGHGRPAARTAPVGGATARGDRPFARSSLPPGRGSARRPPPPSTATFVISRQRIGTAPATCRPPDSAVGHPDDGRAGDPVGGEVAQRFVDAASNAYGDGRRPAAGSARRGRGTPRRRAGCWRSRCGAGVPGTGGRRSAATGMSVRWMPATASVPPRSRAASAVGTMSPAGANRMAESSGSGGSVEGVARRCGAELRWPARWLRPIGS